MLKGLGSRGRDEPCKCTAVGRGGAARMSDEEQSLGGVVAPASMQRTPA